MIKERIGTEASLLGGRIKQGLHNGREGISEFKTAAADKTRRAARHTDFYVHDNAWKLIGVVAGLAFAAGFFVSRKNQEAIAAEAGTHSRTVQEKVQRLNTWEFVHSALPMAIFVWKALQASRCAKK